VSHDEQLLAYRSADGRRAHRQRGWRATVKTVVLLTPEQVDSAAKRSVEYRPPGA
jgi:hypothetical protein